MMQRNSKQKHKIFAACMTDKSLIFITLKELYQIIK